MSKLFSCFTLLYATLLTLSYFLCCLSLIHSLFTTTCSETFHMERCKLLYKNNRRFRFCKFFSVCQWMATDFSWEVILSHLRREDHTEPFGVNFFLFTYVIFHVLNHFLMIYICNFHWNCMTHLNPDLTRICNPKYRNPFLVPLEILQVNYFWFTYEISMS